MKKLLLLLLLTNNVYAKSDVITKITAKGSARSFTDKEMKAFSSALEDGESAILTTNGFGNLDTSFELDLTSSKPINFKMSGADNYQLRCPIMFLNDGKNKVIEQLLVGSEDTNLVINTECFTKDETGKNVKLAVKIGYQTSEFAGVPPYEAFYVWIRNTKYKDSNVLYYGEALIK